MKRQVTILVITSQTILHTTLILTYNVQSSFRLYYIQFKEVKILWEPGARGGMLEPGVGGQITQTSGR